MPQRSLVSSAAKMNTSPHPATSGQIDGLATRNTSWGRASAVPTITAARQRSGHCDSPWTNRSRRSSPRWSSSWSHSGWRLRTIGRTDQPCSAGGEGTAHSSVPAPQGLLPASSPRR